MLTLRSAAYQFEDYRKLERCIESAILTLKCPKHAAQTRDTLCANCPHHLVCYDLNHLLEHIKSKDGDTD